MELMPTQPIRTTPKPTDADLGNALAAARVHPIIAADIRRRHDAAVKLIDKATN